MAEVNSPATQKVRVPPDRRSALEVGRLRACDRRRQHRRLQL